MSIFDKFDKEVDLNKIEAQKKEAAENNTEYEPVPAGKYIVKIENMELGVTKRDNRPMFKVQMRIIESADGKNDAFLSKYKKKPCVFMNKVIYGTKNDGNMIANVEGFLNKLGLDKTFAFVGYADFAEQILDAAEECEPLEFEIDYDDSKFNSISITEVFDA